MPLQKKRLLLGGVIAALGVVLVFCSSFVWSDQATTVEPVVWQEVASSTADIESVSVSTSSAEVTAESPSVLLEDSQSSPEVGYSTVESVPPAPSLEVAVSPESPVYDVVDSPARTQTYTLTSAHQVAIVNGHNAARSQKGLGALTWSAAIALSAQAWADDLAARGCLLEHSDTPYGENLYYSWTTGDFTLQPAVAVKWWLDEEAYYDYEANTCQAGEQCGHYTQAVWRSTMHIGCGVSVCTEGKKKTQMWVCQYDPAGNDGTRPY